jgi:hypothetical protein
MRTRDNLLKRLWDYFNPPRTIAPIDGNQYPLVRSSVTQLRNNLDIPEQPIRTVIDLQTTKQLIEMSYWCYEIRHGISFLAHDCFQNQEGESASWDIKTEDKDGNAIAVNPDTVVMARDLRERRNGRDLILGGDLSLIHI